MTAPPIDPLRHVQTKKIPVAKITLDPDNPNRMSKSKQAALLEVFRKYGFAQDLWVRAIPDGTYRIIDGEHRYRIMRDAGVKSIACKVFLVSDTDVRMLRQIANKLHGEHNRNADAAEYKKILDAGELKAFSDLMATDMEKLEFDIARQFKLTEDETAPRPESTSKPPPKQTKKTPAGTALHPPRRIKYRLNQRTAVHGRHRLSCRDAADELEHTPGNVYDLILTDPPWHTTSLELDKHKNDYGAIYRDLFRVLKPNGWLFVSGTVEMALTLMQTGFQRRFEYVWVKPNATVSLLRKPIKPNAQHELIHAFNKPREKKTDTPYFDREALRVPADTYQRNENSVSEVGSYQTERKTTQPVSPKTNKRWRYQATNAGFREGTTVLHHRTKSTMPHAERTPHPTQKPISLYELIIRGYCPKMGLVLDPFAGSGTTLMAAAKSSRVATVLDIDPGYCSDIAARYQTAYPDAEVKKI